MPRIPHDRPATLPVMTSGSSATGDDYLAKVVKLIPAEVVATYTAIYNLVPSLPESWRVNFYWGNVVFFWVATPVWLWLIGKSEGKLPTVITTVITTLAFGIWAYAISGKLVVGDPGFQPALASILLVLFTFVAGKIPLQ